MASVTAQGAGGFYRQPMPFEAADMPADLLARLTEAPTFEAAEKKKPPNLHDSEGFVR